MPLSFIIVMLKEHTHTHTHCHQIASHIFNCEVPERNNQFSHCSPDLLNRRYIKELPKQNI